VELGVRTAGPAEREALELIEGRPGLTIHDLADRLGVTAGRAYAIVVG
jgi:hypothetical protein